MRNDHQTTPPDIETPPTPRIRSRRFRKCMIYGGYHLCYGRNMYYKIWSAKKWDHLKISKGVQLSYHRFQPAHGYTARMELSIVVSADPRKNLEGNIFKCDFWKKSKIIWMFLCCPKNPFSMCLISRALYLLPHFILFEKKLSFGWFFIKILCF